MNKESPLLAEDGATFVGTIKTLSNNQFRASCGAKINEGSSITEEVPQIKIFDSKIEARNWIHKEAAKRGFKQLSLNEE